MRIAVCDDEKIALKIITSAVAEELKKRKIDGQYITFTDSADLIEKINAGEEYDVLFVDICMPGMDGIEVGLMLRQLAKESLLVYVSSRDDLVFDTFRAQPFRFIRKKMFTQELPAVIRDLIDEISRRNSNKVSFSCGNSTLLISPHSIWYVESFRKNQIVHCEDAEYEIHSSFQKIIEELKDYPFVQIHKSFFVNCSHVRSIERGKLELDNHVVLPIGRSRQNAVKEAFRMTAMKNFEAF